MFSKFDKAIAPLVIGAVFLVLNQYGVTEATTVGEVVSMVVAAVGVYLVPNKG